MPWECPWGESELRDEMKNGKRNSTFPLVRIVPILVIAPSIVAWTVDEGACWNLIFSQFHHCFMFMAAKVKNRSLYPAHSICDQNYERATLHYACFLKHAEGNYVVNDTDTSRNFRCILDRGWNCRLQISQRLIQGILASILNKIIVSFPMRDQRNRFVRARAHFSQSVNVIESIV